MVQGEVCVFVCGAVAFCRFVGPTVAPVGACVRETVDAAVVLAVAAADGMKCCSIVAADVRCMSSVWSRSVRIYRVDQRGPQQCRRGLGSIDW